MECLIGNRQVSVKYRNGNSESVTVRAVPVRHLNTYLGAFVDHDEGKLIELYTDKKPEWSDALTLESVEAVLAAGEEMNRDPFASYAQRTIARGKVLGSLLPAPTPSKTESPSPSSNG